MNHKVEMAKQKLTLEMLRNKLSTPNDNDVEIEILDCYTDNFKGEFWMDKPSLAFYLKNKAESKIYQYVDLYYVEYDEEDISIDQLVELINSKDLIHSINLYSGKLLNDKYENTRVYNRVKHSKQIMWVDGFQESNVDRELLQLEGAYIKTYIDNKTNTCKVVIYDKESKEYVAEFKGSLYVKYNIYLAPHDIPQLIKLFLTGYQIFQYGREYRIDLETGQRELTKVLHYINSLINEACRVFPQFENKFCNNLSVNLLADYEEFNIGGGFKKELVTNDLDDLKNKLRRLSSLLHVIITVLSYKLDNYLSTKYSSVDLPK